jgi:hypothetical protein
MQLLEQAQALLNFDGQAPFDVNTLDAVVNTMYRGQGDAVSDFWAKNILILLDFI